MSKFIGNYYPSNSDEGMWFVDKFCMKCANCNPDPNGDKQCSILIESLFGDPLDMDEYQWVYDENGNPKCKKHKPWDWETMGDPDDPNNPNYIQLPDPNQLNLFLNMEDINIEFDDEPKKEEKHPADVFLENHRKQMAERSIEQYFKNEKAHLENQTQVAYASMPQGLKEAQQRNGVRDHGLVSGEFEWGDKEQTHVIWVPKENGRWTIANPNNPNEATKDLINRKFDGAPYHGTNDKPLFIMGIDPIGDNPPSQAAYVRPISQEKFMADVEKTAEHYNVKIPEESQPDLLDDFEAEFINPEIQFTETTKDSYDGNKAGRAIYDIDEAANLPKGILDKALAQAEPQNSLLSEGGILWPLGKIMPTTLEVNRKPDIFIQVLGEPTAQKRHKSTSFGGFTRQYDPSASDKADFLSIVQNQAPETPINSPIKLDITFHFARPKSHYRSGSKSHLLKDNVPEWHVSRPDTDNCIKFVMDALNKVYWRDDSLICCVSMNKRYSSKPRTEIGITIL